MTNELREYRVEFLGERQPVTIKATTKAKAFRKASRRYDQTVNSVIERTKLSPLEEITHRVDDYIDVTNYVSEQHD